MGPYREWMTGAAPVALKAALSSSPRFTGSRTSRLDRYFQLATPSSPAIYFKLRVVSRRNRAAISSLSVSLLLRRANSASAHPRRRSSSPTIFPALARATRSCSSPA